MIEDTCVDTDILSSSAYLNHPEINLKWPHPQRVNKYSGTYPRSLNEEYERGDIARSGWRKAIYTVRDRAIQLRPRKFTHNIKVSIENFYSPPIRTS